jgi:hypothetical protein
MRQSLACLAAGLIAGCGGSTEPSTTPPGDLTLVATVPIPPQYGIHDTFVRDGLVFVSAWNTGLIIMDVGNGIRGGTPAHPVEVSRIVPDDDGVPGGPAVHTAWWFHNPVSGESRYVFVTQEGPGLLPISSLGDIHAIDISDLSQPRQVAFYHMNADPSAGSHNLWMDEAAQVLYASFYNGGVVALDVAGVLSGDLASREIARLKPSSTAYVWGIQGSAGSLYATDMLGGLYQLRFGAGALTLAAGGDNVPERYSSDLFVSGGYAYTGTWGGVARNNVPGNALKIWKLGPTGAPALADSVVLDSVITVGDVKGSADGKLLAVSADKGDLAGLYIYSLADPARPALIGRSFVTGGVHTARVADVGGRRFVFAAKNPGPNGTPALLIYDVTGLNP